MGQTTEEKYADILQLSSDYHNKRESVKLNLPYHINVIDELHINENGHSRILTQLLKFQNANKEYEILQSLIKYLANISKTSFFETLEIGCPEITQEIERIDLWVRGKDYAIIFENKIYNAADQDAQLSRYIEKTRQHGYKEDSIFVVYLSNSGGDPDLQSWGEYKDNFKDRFFNLSFRDNILYWLKNVVAPNVRHKDVFLKEAIDQYVDYLEGLFDLRTIQNDLNMEINQFITQKLKLEECNSERERFSKVKKYLEDTDEFRSQLWNWLDKEGKKKVKETESMIRQKYPNIGLEESEFSTLITDFKGKKVKVSINVWAGKLYCQVEYCSGENFCEEDSLEKEVEDILKNHHSTQRWQYFDRLDYDGVCKMYETVIGRLTA